MTEQPSDIIDRVRNTELGPGSQARKLLMLIDHLMGHPPDARDTSGVGIIFITEMLVYVLANYTKGHDDFAHAMDIVVDLLRKANPEWLRKANPDSQRGGR